MNDLYAELQHYVKSLDDDLKDFKPIFDEADNDGYKDCMRRVIIDLLDILSQYGGE